jgi:hypothetical protein
MNKTLIYLIVFLVLGGLAAWMLMEGEKDEKTSLLGEDRKFAVEDAEEIYKIFIADRNKNKTTLERNGDHWIYNGKYKARPNAMENLLDAITRVQIKYQPPAKAVKHMISSLATEGIKVEIYNKKNDLIKSYYVGGSTSDERGTFMMMAEADQPYVANIPNWSGNIRFRYNLKGDDWRENVVFSAKPEEVKSIFVQYPKQRNKSFRIDKKEGKFAVSPFYGITPKKNQEVSQGKIEQFLINFELVSSRGYDNSNPEKDSISATIPFAKINLEKSNGKTTVLDLYPIMPKQQFDTKTGETIPLGEIENYYALLNEEDFIVVSQKIIQNLLWAYDYFYE